MARLQELPRSVVRIRADLPETRADAGTPDVRHQLPPAELFESFHREQTGLDPDPEIVRLFVELLGGDAPARITHQRAPSAHTVRGP